MGILQLEFLSGENAASIELTGKETFVICINEQVSIGEILFIRTDNGKEFKAKLRLDTAPEIE